MSCLRIFDVECEWKFIHRIPALERYRCRPAPRRVEAERRPARQGAAWRLFLFLWRGKKWARARSAPPPHAPRSGARGVRGERGSGPLPDSLSFATSQPPPKVTVQASAPWPAADQVSDGPPPRVALPATKNFWKSSRANLNLARTFDTAGRNVPHPASFD